MCVVALAWQVYADWPLILVGNRDEFHARPSAALAAWNDESGIIGGRDLQAGGTWLGVRPANRRIVVVTNVRGALPDPAKASRGALVVDMLRGDGRFADPAPADLDRFNAFNLFAIDGDAARLLTNRPGAQILEVDRGIHALANEPVDAPCPRAERLASALRRAMARPQFAPDDALRLLAAEDAPALFLRGPVYGTRASTLVAIDARGRGLIVERRYEAGGRSIGTTALIFRIG